MTALSNCHLNYGDLFHDPGEEVSHKLKPASHLPDHLAGIGTLAFARLSRLHRAGPSASLDKSVSCFIQLSVRRHNSYLSTRRRQDSYPHLRIMRTFLNTLLGLHHPGTGEKRKPLLEKKGLFCKYI
jgi:hypothetical protein